MSLEKDIMLADVRSEHQRALINILYTYYYLVDRMNSLFKNNAVTRQQYNVLRILKKHHPHHISVNVIKRSMFDKMSDVSRIVERLRIKGLVQRQSGLKDKRSVDVSITEKGLELLSIMDPQVDTLGQLLGNLTEPETLVLNTLLDKIRTLEETTHISGGQRGHHSDEKIITLAALKL
jgi:DNA-binding MarR family transcriptional regulator